MIKRKKIFFFSYKINKCLMQLSKKKIFLILNISILIVQVINLNVKATRVEYMLRI